MNQQLAIVFNPDDNTRTVEGAQLSRRFNESGQLISITIASATLYNSSGGIIFQGDLLGGGVINDNGLLTTIWDANTVTALLSPKINYKIIWVVDGTILTRWYDVVYWKMQNPISEADLLAENPELSKYRPEKKCQITSITNSTKYVCDQLSEPFQFWIGSIFQSNSRFLPNAEKRVTEWDEVTQTLTIDSPFSQELRQGDYFTLKRGYYPEILSSWQSIQEMIAAWIPKFGNNCANVPWDQSQFNTVVDGYDFRRVHLYQTMIYIANDLRLKLGDAYDLWLQRYSQLMSKAIGEIKAKVDADNSGSPDYFRSGQIWCTL